MNWISDITTYFRQHPDQEVTFGNRVSAYSMPENAAPAAVILPPLESFPIDQYLKPRHRGPVYCVVRGTSHAQTIELAHKAKKILQTEVPIDMNGLDVLRMRLTNIPLVYPRSEGDLFETSLDFEITMIDDRI